MFILFVVALFIVIVELRSQKKRLPIHALRITSGFVSYGKEDHLLAAITNDKCFILNANLP